jgi:hypothetical protein
MSEILEALRCQGERDEFIHQLSCKLNNRQQAAIEAVSGLGSVGNKSNAVRLLIDLGWEAIENDGIFESIINRKYEIERLYSEMEDM